MSPAQPLLVIPVLEARPLTYSSDNERVNPWSEGNPDSFIIAQLSHKLLQGWTGVCMCSFIHPVYIYLVPTICWALYKVLG